jgi:hypothetical protein
MQVYYLMLSTDDEVKFCSCISVYIYQFHRVAWSALPIEVAPEAIVEVSFEYRLKYIFFINLAMELIEYNSSFPSEVTIIGQRVQRS